MKLANLETPVKGAGAAQTLSMGEILGGRYLWRGILANGVRVWRDLKALRPTKYTPHQGVRECARRVRSAARSGYGNQDA